MKKYLAELLGTFALTLAVALSLAGSFPVPTPVIAALTLGLFVYTIGHTSGAHINPAVTIGLLLIKKIDLKDSIMYLIAQFAGAALAFVLIPYLATPATVIASATLATGIAELIGTFFFIFGVTAVVLGKTPKEFSGIIVGGSLLLGIMLAAGAGSNGVLNPAVAFGIGSFSWPYVAGPIAGSILGTYAYKLLNHS